MTRTPITGLIGAAAFAGVASFIVVRRFYGLLASLSMLVPASLWIIALACVYFAVMVRKRRSEGKVGLDRSQLNPMMAANLMNFGKASAWAGAVCAGTYLGALTYTVPQLGTLAAAAEDLPSVISGALAGIALAAAGVWLERSCEVSPPSAGEGAG